MIFIIGHAPDLQNAEWSTGMVELGPWGMHLLLINAESQDRAIDFAKDFISLDSKTPFRGSLYILDGLPFDESKIYRVFPKQPNDS